MPRTADGKFAPIVAYSGPLCSILGCGKPICSRGWCRMHYERWHKHGDPSAIVTRENRRRRDIVANPPPNVRWHFTAKHWDIWWASRYGGDARTLELRKGIHEMRDRLTPRTLRKVS